jgi:ATP-dependent DNA helicase DinG
MDSIEKIFSAKGPIAAKLPGFENRPQQLAMAAGIRQSIRKNRHLIVEAGTGIGKSMAYLVPFILWSAGEREKESKAPCKTVISTYTRTLQEQLINKDLPFLEKALQVKFRYALCLGSENYICRRRLNQSFQYGLFDTREEAKQLSDIAEWHESTDSGLRLRLPFEPDDRVWMKVCRETDLCMGKKCSYFGRCCFFRAKAQQAEADILVVNHHLFFANLASGGKVLPQFGAAVFDEAQNIEEAATEYLGIEVSNSGIRRLLDSVYNPRTGKGLITRSGSFSPKDREDILESLDEIRAASDAFFTDVLDKFGGSVQKNVVRRTHGPNLFENVLDAPLERLGKKLKSLLDSSEEEEYCQEVSAYSARCSAARAGLDVFIRQPYDDHVYYLDIAPRARAVRITLHGSPVDIASVLKKQVFEEVEHVVLTSATLSVNKSFDYIRERLGLDSADELLLDSPFDYGAQAALYVAGDLPDPAYKTEAFQEKAVTHIKEILEISRGRAFVLFTSYETLERTYRYLGENLPGMQLFRQGDMPRWQLLEKFRKGRNAVLLGTNTFWQGVDVPGEALQCVIIFKLPFAVPDNPVTEAKMEFLSKQGKDPFVSYQLPQAIIMLKQGFGRLIRTATDSGIVAILDPRIKTRYYGRWFLESLPKCKMVKHISELAPYFK